MSTTPNLLIPFLSALTGPNTAAKIDGWNQSLTGTATPTNGFGQMFYLRILDLTGQTSPYTLSSALYPGAWFIAGTTSGTFAIVLPTQVGFYLLNNDTAHDVTIQMGSGNVVTIPADGKMHFVYSDGTGNLYTAS